MNSKQENAERLQYGGNYRRLASASSIVACTFAGLLLSGCVGSQVSSTLETAAMTSPETDQGSGFFQDDGSGTAVDFATALTTIPIPQRSPIPAAADIASGTQLALASQTDTPAAVAASEQIQATQIIEPATVDAANADGAASMETAALDSSTDPASAQAAIPQPAPLAATAEPAKPKKPGGLFGLFMAAKPAQPKTVQPAAPRIALAANSPRPAASMSASNSALPGVKRQSAIFGIGDEQGSGEDADVLPSEGVQVASVGSMGRLLSPNGLILQTSAVQVDCFKQDLLAVLKKVERRYGKKVMVTSGYRSPQRNRRAGGVSNSTHIYCKAADIQVEGVSKWDLAKYLRSIPGRGGVGTYCRTESVHIDVGSQRDWHHPCRRSGSRTKKKRA